jgi:thiol reductant ABC exporter CydC subunit
VSQRSGDLLARAVSDIETLQDFYVRALAPPLVAAITALGMWLLLGAYDPLFAFTFLAFYLLAAVGVPVLAQRLGREVGSEVVAARSELQVALLDGIQGAVDIVAFGRERAHEHRVAALDDNLLQLQQRLARVNALQTALTSLLTNAAVWTMLVVAVPFVHDGRLDGVYLAVLVLATLSGFEAVLPLPAAAAHLGASLAAARRLFDVAGTQRHRDAGTVVDLAALPVQQPSHDGAAPGLNAPPNIVVRGLTFRYAPDDPPALRDVSFEVPAGGSVAVVGPSGAGKSTLGNVLLKFLEYDEGTITLGGRELREWDGEEARRLFAVVAQDTHLFNTTIRGNLLVARPEASEEEIWRAVRLARLGEFVRSLPQGLDTPVGEQGLLLSGGERQRVAIARAFLKDAPILLLDEPSANLDSLTERDLLESISTLAQGRTTLLITHRLVGLEAAGEILVMREGAIVERGRHDELLLRDGLYAKMWRLQAEVLDSAAEPAV